MAPHEQVREEKGLHVCLEAKMANKMVFTTVWKRKWAKFLILNVDFRKSWSSIYKISSPSKVVLKYESDQQSTINAIAVMVSASHCLIQRCELGNKRLFFRPCPMKLNAPK